MASDRDAVQELDGAAAAQTPGPLGALAAMYHVALMRAPSPRASESVEVCAAVSFFSAELQLQSRFLRCQMVEIAGALR